MSTASVAAAVAGMRVVGVIDLKDGTAVHAVRGERERYRPVSSAIGGDDGDALALARGFREALGIEEVYVADLDAIVGRSDPPREATTPRCSRALAGEARLMVDAGVSEPTRGARAAGPRRAARHRRDRDAGRPPMRSTGCSPSCPTAP